MIHVELNAKTGIAEFRPEGALSKNDFDVAASIVDQYLDTHDTLNGLIINTETFPGWESFGAMVKHLQFVKNHHERLLHVALVTNSKFGDLIEKMARHFVAAEVKHFPYSQLSEATNWILHAKQE